MRCRAAARRLNRKDFNGWEADTPIQGLGFGRVQIHRTKRGRRNGYPSAGTGAEVGNKGAPRRLSQSIA